MPEQRTSVIWSLERDVLEWLVAKCETFSEVLRYFELSHKGGNCRTLKRRLDEEGISYAHIPQGRAALRGRAMGGRQRTLAQVLCENSNASRHHLKMRLIREGVLVNECANCGLGPEWNGASLVMELDHINGVSDDNRIENLRLLCPNCHSQTETYSGRSKPAERELQPVPLDLPRVQLRVEEPEERLCPACGGQVSTGSRSGLCISCYAQAHLRRKVERPSHEELLHLVAELGYTGAGRRFGVSDNAIRKWLRPDSQSDS